MLDTVHTYIWVRIMEYVDRWNHVACVSKQFNELCRLYKRKLVIKHKPICTKICDVEVDTPFLYASQFKWLNDIYVEMRLHDLCQFLLNIHPTCNQTINTITIRMPNYYSEMMVSKLLAIVDRFHNLKLLTINERQMIKN